jgi:RNA polymerase sigma-70 factor (ECF subfamily)
MKPANLHTETERASPDPGLFLTTHWSVVLQAGESESAQAGQALEKLCTAYWYPLYAYVRRQGHSVEDAEDLTQKFFARFLERKYLRLADRNRGRFRTFLLTSLKHFLINDWKREKREKRGGGQKVLSLNEELAESRFCLEPAVEQPPDTVYDREWAAIVMEQTMAGLRAEFERSGKLDLFERLKPFVWGEKNALSYAAMAAELGMSEGAVKVTLHRLRRRFGELLRGEIAKTVATLVEVEEELQYLGSIVAIGLSNFGNSSGEKV